jgi:hypothetical protein
MIDTTFECELRYPQIAGENRNQYVVPKTIPDLKDMSYIRSKMINGYGPYYYEVMSVREGDTVRQVHIRYIGKEAPGSIGQQAGVGYIQFEKGTVSERKESKEWSKARHRRAQMIAEATGSSYFQADALAKTAIRMDLDPDRVDWDQLQGTDLSHQERVQKLEEMSGISAKTAEDYELESELYESDRAERMKLR